MSLDRHSQPRDFRQENYDLTKLSLPDPGARLATPNFAGDGAIILIGPPGAGKGTQARILSRAKGIPHISTGDLLREEAATGSPLGKRISALIDQGNFVPDDMILELLESRLSRPDCQRGFLLDGYPRTLSQAKTLDSLLQRLGVHRARAVVIDVSEAELVQRIVARGKNGSGRADDTAEIAKKRLSEYQQKTLPVAQHYHSQGSAKVVDGSAPVDQVAEKIERALEGQ